MTYTYVRFCNVLRARLDDERGASMVEYALLLAMLAMAAILAITSFGDGLDQRFENMGSTINSTLDGR